MREDIVRLCFCLSLFALSVDSVLAQPKELPGVGLDRTRVMYTDVKGKRGVSVIYNNNSDHDYLIQAWVAPPDTMVLSPKILKAQDDERVPFFVVPPLVRLDAHGRQTFRLLRRQGSLPQDRESVFLLSVKAIPNTPVVEETTGNGILRMAMTSTIKLFYRPLSLPPGGIAVAAKTLRFCRVENALTVYNPSPFYLTFSFLYVGQQRVEGDAIHWMVPPLGEMHYPLRVGTRGLVRWSLLDERGEATQSNSTLLMSSGCGGLRK